MTGWKSTSPSTTRTSSSTSSRASQNACRLPVSAGAGSAISGVPAGGGARGAPGWGGAGGGRRAQPRGLGAAGDDDDALDAGEAQRLELVVDEWPAAEVGEAGGTGEDQGIHAGALGGVEGGA